MDTHQEGGNNKMLGGSHSAKKQLAFEGQESKDFKIGQGSSFTDIFEDVSCAEEKTLQLSKGMDNTNKVHQDDDKWQTATDKGRLWNTEENEEKTMQVFGLYCNSWNPFNFYSFKELRCGTSRVKACVLHTVCYS